MKNDSQIVMYIECIVFYGANCKFDVTFFIRFCVFCSKDKKGSKGSKKKGHSNINTKRSVIDQHVWSRVQGTRPILRMFCFFYFPPVCRKTINCIS